MNINGKLSSVLKTNKEVRGIKTMKMRFSLGLDIGTNSIGWSVYDDCTKRFTARGSSVFPDGMNNEDSETPAAARRAKRQMRRMRYHKRIRKLQLLKILIDNDMCPLEGDVLHSWKRSGILPSASPKFIEWVSVSEDRDPYELRNRAANEKIPLYDLGRILYLISNRRGYKSIRKSGSDKDGAVQKSISSISNGMQELADERHLDRPCTIGEFFHHCRKESNNNVAIRRQWTGREEHYIPEFRRIMKVQGFDEQSKVYKDLYDAIFSQRPLRSMSYLKAQCPLESRFGHKQTCASKSNPLFEEFRMWQFVNNLNFVRVYSLEKIPLTLEEKKLACSAFMRKEQQMDFSQISKLFRDKFVHGAMKFWYYKDDDSIPTCSTRYCMKDAFGDVPYDEQEVFNILYSAEDDDKIKAWLNKHYPQLDDKGIKKLLRIKIQDGYASYSLKAIKKILPFLRKGYDFELSKFLAKLPDFIPDFESHEESIVLRLKEQRNYLKNFHDFIESKPPTLMELRKNYLVNEYGLTEEQWGKLYLKGKGNYEGVDVSDGRVPPINLGMYRNPTVQAVGTNVRRLVNCLLDSGVIHTRDTMVIVELAREVNTVARRSGIQKWQARRAKARLEAKSAIEEITGTAATKLQIDRWMLWKEQDEKCIYTGKNISIADVLSVDGSGYDIEHTIPITISGDDSLSNKTICSSEYNREVKKNRIPSECGNYDSQIVANLECFIKKRDKAEQYYKKSKMRARGALDANAKAIAEYARIDYEYWREKVRRFQLTAEELRLGEDKILSRFQHRQLVDTGAIATQVVDMLKTVFEKVYAVNGNAVALARKCWGLQTSSIKDRTDHIHHADDAAVIALLTHRRFSDMCRALNNYVDIASCMDGNLCKPPFEDFVQQVRETDESIFVKHIYRRTPLKQSHKRDKLAFPHMQKDNSESVVRYVTSKGDTIRGALHNDTYYGCIVNPFTGEKEFTKRIALQGSIADLEKKVVNAIDKRLQEVVLSELRRMKEEGTKNIDVGMVKWPNGIAIRSITVKAEQNAQKPLEIRCHTIKSKHSYKNPYYVLAAPNSNFRIAVFERNGKRTIAFDSLFAWAKNRKRVDFVPFNKQKGFLGYVYQGAMAITSESLDICSLKNESASAISRRLFVITSFSGAHQQIMLRYHREARAASEIRKLKKPEMSEVPVVKEVGKKEMTSKLLFEGIDFRLTLDGRLKFLR